MNGTPPRPLDPIHENLAYEVGAFCYAFVTGQELTAIA